MYNLFAISWGYEALARGLLSQYSAILCSFPLLRLL